MRIYLIKTFNPTMVEIGKLQWFPSSQQFNSLTKLNGW